MVALVQSNAASCITVKTLADLLRKEIMSARSNVSTQYPIYREFDEQKTYPFYASSQILRNTDVQ